MPESFPRYGVGDQLSAEAFNRMARQAEALSAGRPGGRLTRIQGPQGDLYSNGPPDSIWIEIIGQDGDCPNAYQWIAVQGRTGSCVPFSVSESGSGDGVYPAFEVNGRDDVPAGMIVRAWESANREGLEFEFGIPCGTTPISVITCVSLRAPGSGSIITGEITPP